MDHDVNVCIDIDPLADPGAIETASYCDKVHELWGLVTQTCAGRASLTRRELQDTSSGRQTTGQTMTEQ